MRLSFYHLEPAAIKWNALTTVIYGIPIVEAPVLLGTLVYSSR